MSGSSFRERVVSIVKQIPTGRVMTYGQLAALSGNARAARIVGGIAHYGDASLPWHRVVNKRGGLASGYPGGRRTHKMHLEQEGIVVTDDFYVKDVDKYLWAPNKESSRPPLLVIVGPTASGKSSLALTLAQKLGGEIICADSWTVRKEVNIGTAKPSHEDRQLVRHHLLDVAEPCGDFTAAVFKDMANQAIDNIAQKHKLPIMVGGTGLYIDGVLFDYSFLPHADRGQRRELNKLSAPELVEFARAKGLSTEDIDTRNKRRIIRLIEANGREAQRSSMRGNTLVIGIKMDKSHIHERIKLRVDEMVNRGLQHEVADLVQKYGWDCEALKGIGYVEWREYFNSTQTLEQTKARIVQSTKKLAKRQQTWFKRNNSIQWLYNSSDIVDSATTLVNKHLGIKS